MRKLCYCDANCACWSPVTYMLVCSRSVHNELEKGRSVFLSVKLGFHYPSWRPKLTGDRFPLPVNTGRIEGRAFPLAELMGNGNRSPINSGSGNRALAAACLICTRVSVCYCCGSWIKTNKQWTRGSALNRVHNSRRPLSRLFALCDPVTVTFWPNINWWAMYRDGLSVCRVWWF